MISLSFFDKYKEDVFRYNDKVVKRNKRSQDKLPLLEPSVDGYLIWLKNDNKL